ncbi:uncharacterized protein LOC119339234 [Triticum dicoccoides]|uniref:uncharacterized protein LOC119339234 n=1 Tax=Triticum dicoccoides TaxID=85692 RepID=UPI00189153F7|nr:uncharacterized protein LOC119339234 [Triticum dicoccoides]
MSRHFNGCEFLHVPRADNDAADALARIGSTRQAILAGVSLERLRKPSIKPSSESESIFMPTDPTAVGSGSGASAVGLETLAGGPGAAVTAPSPEIPAGGPGAAVVGLGTSSTPSEVAGSSPPPPSPATLVPVAVFTVVEEPSWARPIHDFLVSRVLPANEVLARQIQRRAGAHTIINGELARHSVTGIFQLCVEPKKGMEILSDIHQGECGHHAASRALVAKAFRHVFFWPTALDDAKELVWKCKGCQKFSTKQHQPPSALKTIPITWSFVVWGLDMVGLFKTACGGMTHLLVVVDKFSKWIEAKPIKKINGPTAVTFITDITVRYGVPHGIIINNGINFARGALSNGQVERSNGIILSGIKPRLVEPLERSADCGIEELSVVLWTTPNRSTVFMPFFLVYGAEAIIPTDIEFDSPSVTMAMAVDDEMSCRFLPWGLPLRSGSGYRVTPRPDEPVYVTGA